MDYAHDADSRRFNQLVIYKPDEYGLESSDEDEHLDETEDTNNDIVKEKHRSFGLGLGIPHVGMKFSTDDGAYEFYNEYARRMGFGIRRSLSARGKDGEVIRRMFVCSREGFKIRNDGDGRAVKRPRSGKRGCLAHMSIQKSKDGDGGWKIKYFNESHNHELLSSPSKVAMLRSHRKDRLRPGRKPLPVDHFVDNIVSQLPAEHLRLKKTSNLSRDCITMIQRYIEHREATESCFYYAIQFDEDNTFRSVFWADGRARMSYMQFSDAVAFDTSYTEKGFLLPFASFTGVNHHKQPTLFACALLADEREETFEWLFETLLNCMWEKAPGALVSDHDLALCNAIKKVFPNTHHRYCMWHVGLHEDECLHALSSSCNPSFDEDHKKWARNAQTVEEAEICWLSLKDKYRRDFEEPLTENQKNELNAWTWLESMYDQRHHWVEAYLKDTFSAGIKSSQGSESMNSFFDGFINSTTPLHEFVVQYDKALSSRRDEEDSQDTSCLGDEPDFQGMHELVASAGRAYTRNVFDSFQSDFRSIYCYFHEKVGTEKGFTIYNVTSNVVGEVGVHSVKCKVSEKFFLCTCAKFESEGILCKHILYIMKQIFRLQSIPDRYILARWTPNARLARTNFRWSLTDVGANGGEITPLETWRLREKVNQVVEKASHDQKFYDTALKVVEDLLKQVDLVEQGVTKSITEPSTEDYCSASRDLDAFSAAKAKNKRQLRELTRISSGMQATQSQAQSRRTMRSTSNWDHYM